MQGAVARAQELYRKTENAVIAGQFENPVCASVHYQTTGVEIERQTQGKVDVFVAAVGTGGTLTGTGRYLKEKNPSVQVVAVEPQKSPLLSGGKAAPHGIQGIGANFIPKILDRDIYNEVLLITDETALQTARLVHEADNLFVGISSGANLAAAIELAKREGNEGKTIVTVFPDGGNRYLSIFEKM
jgi:cysteine synthase A